MKEGLLPGCERAFQFDLEMLSEKLKACDLTLGLLNRAVRDASDSMGLSDCQVRRVLDHFIDFFRVQSPELVCQLFAKLPSFRFSVFGFHFRSVLLAWGHE